MRFLFKPRYWVMNNPYSRVHDLALNKLLDSYRFEDIAECTAYLGNTEIWITNNPYAVGIRSLSSSSRPSRKTIWRMNQALEADVVKEIITLND